MRHRSIVYPVCRVDLVELEPGESFRFSQKAARASYGVFALGGSRSAPDAVEITDPAQYTVTKMTEGAVAGRMFNKVGQRVPNDRQHGWANDELGREEVVITAAEPEARWICLGRVDGQLRQVNHLRVEGRAALASDWGFIVARGSVECVQKTVGELACFRSRQLEVGLMGRADILVVS